MVTHAHRVLVGLPTPIYLTGCLRLPHAVTRFVLPLPVLATPVGCHVRFITHGLPDYAPHAVLRCRLHVAARLRLHTRVVALHVTWFFVRSAFGWFCLHVCRCPLRFRSICLVVPYTVTPHPLRAHIVACSSCIYTCTFATPFTCCGWLPLRFPLLPCGYMCVRLPVWITVGYGYTVHVCGFWLRTVTG